MFPCGWVRAALLDGQVRELHQRDAPLLQDGTHVLLKAKPQQRTLVLVVRVVDVRQHGVVLVVELDELVLDDVPKQLPRVPGAQRLTWQDLRLEVGAHQPVDERLLVGDLDRHPVVQLAPLGTRGHP